MKVLVTIKGEPDATMMKMVDEISKGSEVTVVDFGKDRDYDSIVEKIERADRVIAA